MREVFSWDEKFINLRKHENYTEINIQLAICDGLATVDAQKSPSFIKCCGYL